MMIEKKVKNKRRMCRFCNEPEIPMSYKEPKLLQPYLTPNFKILPRRITGNCARHQRDLTQTIKRARILAFLPFTTAHT